MYIFCVTKIKVITLAQFAISTIKSEFLSIFLSNEHSWRKTDDKSKRQQIIYRTDIRLPTIHFNVKQIIRKYNFMLSIQIISLNCEFV